jgi:hypothetical protein
VFDVVVVVVFFVVDAGKSELSSSHE